MQFKLSKMNLMLALVVVVSLIAVLGCAEEEAEEPVAPAAAAPAAPAQAAPAAPAVAPAPAPAAPQAPQQPAAAAPAAQPAAPAAPAAAIGPTGAVPERTGPTAPAPTTAEYKYVAKKTPPGGFPSYVWDGPLPTNLKESPASAELVEQGKILPLEQRIPTGDDVMVVPPTQEIVHLYNPQGNEVERWIPSDNGGHSVLRRRLDVQRGTCCATQLLQGSHLWKPHGVQGCGRLHVHTHVR